MFKQHGVFAYMGENAQGANINAPYAEVFDDGMATKFIIKVAVAEDNMEACLKDTQVKSYQKRYCIPDWRNVHVVSVWAKSIPSG